MYKCMYTVYEYKKKKEQKNKCEDNMTPIYYMYD